MPSVFNRVCQNKRACMPFSVSKPHTLSIFVLTTQPIIYVYSRFSCLLLCQFHFYFIFVPQKTGPLSTLTTKKDINYSQWKTLEIVLVCNDLLIRSQILWDLASCRPTQLMYSYMDAQMHTSKRDCMCVQTDVHTHKCHRELYATKTLPKVPEGYSLRCPL